MSKFIALASRLAIVAIPLALAGVGMPAAAEQAQGSGALRLAQTEVGGFSQEKLQSYAAAVMEVQKVDAAWQPKLSEAESPDEIEEMTRQATDEMIGEIEAQGLTVAEYNSITRAAEQDQQLYDHIMTLLAEAPQ